MTNRNHSIDVWRGVAIISVIGIHVCNVAISFPSDNHNHLIGLFFRAIFNFAVAGFFVFAGYFAPDACEIRETGFLSYCRKRLLRIWIPYLLWTGLYLILLDRPAFLKPTQLLEAIFLGRGIGVGYFVIVLSSLIVLHPVVVRIPRNYLLSVAACVSALSVVVLYWARIEHPGHRFVSFPSITSVIFTPWLVFYYYGFCLRKASGFPLRKLALLSAIVLSLTMSFFESIWISSHLGLSSLAGSQIKFTSYLASLFISAYAIFYRVRIFNKLDLLAWAGERSYVLYLSHILFLLVVERLLANRMSWLLEMQEFYIPLAILMTFSGASICIYISERILPEVAVRYVLGISKPATGLVTQR